MACTTHSAHSHVHGKACGHKAIRHEDHIDYLHDSHLHHPHDGHVDEHTLSISASNKASCTPAHACSGHEAKHVHSATCGHEAIPHGDHIDYLVNGHLHHTCQAHCDDHGPLAIA